MPSGSEFELQIIADTRLTSKAEKNRETATADRHRQPKLGTRVPLGTPQGQGCHGRTVLSRAALSGDHTLLVPGHL